MEKQITIIESELTMPVISLPVKTTLVRSGDKVVMISPVPKILEFKDQVDAFGTPTDIVAPSGFHHLGIKDAAKMYPHAKLWGAPVLKSKRKDINWHRFLPTDWPYSDELQAILLGGMPKIDEVVFYHQPSKSLIVADMFFNHIHGQGLGYWLIFNLFGTYKRFAMSKFFAKFIKNKEEFHHSLEKILSLQIKRIIVSHGEDVTEDIPHKLRAALTERGLR